MSSILLLLLLLGNNAWSAPTETAGVSLLDAKKFAVEHNLEVISLRNSLQEMKARSRRTKSAYYPEIGVAGGVDTQSDSKNNESAAVGYLYGNYNLFNGFSDKYDADVADLEVEKAEIKLSRSELKVALEVERVFHLYLFKKGAKAFRKESLAQNDEHRKLARQKRAAGLSADSDLMEFDLRDAILRSDLALIEQELEEARTNLKILLGEEIGANIEPVGNLRHEHLKGSLMDYIKKIKDNSEEILTASRNLSISSVQSKKWVAGFLPRFDLEAKAGYLPLAERPIQGGGAISVMALLKMDLFSGFDTISHKKEAQANFLKTEAQLKGAILSAISQMDISYRRIKTIQNRVDLEEENLDRAEKYYKSVLSEYKRGLKNSVDLKQAAEVHFDAHLRKEQYKFEFLSKRIELEKSLGTTVEIETESDLQHDHSKPKKKS